MENDQDGDGITKPPFCDDGLNFLNQRLSTGFFFKHTPAFDKIQYLAGADVLEFPNYFLILLGIHDGHEMWRFSLRQHTKAHLNTALNIKLRGILQYSI